MPYQTIYKENAIKMIEDMERVFDISRYTNFLIESDDNGINSSLWDRNKKLFDEIYWTFAKEAVLIQLENMIEVCRFEDLEFLNKVKLEVGNLYYANNWNKI